MYRKFNKYDTCFHLKILPEWLEVNSHKIKQVSSTRSAHMPWQKARVLGERRDILKERNAKGTRQYPCFW